MTNDSWNILNDKLAFLEEERVELQQKNKKQLPFHFILPLLAVIAVGFVALPAFFFAAMLFGAISFGVHYATIGSAFKKIKGQAREELLREFMQQYYPDITHRYQIDAKSGKAIIKNAALISANIYKEEDVVTGSTKDADFYLSEIILQRSSGKSTVTVFDGMLFKLKLKGKNFPDTKLYKKRHINLFRSPRKDAEYGFYYSTADEEAFRNSLGPLFPFIRHLMNESKDVRIRAQGDEIVIMMGSKVKFLDDPKPRLNEPLVNDKYFENMGKQLHSFLYIINAFASDMGNDEISDNLEKLVLRDPHDVRGMREQNDQIDSEDDDTMNLRLRL